MRAKLRAIDPALPLYNTGTLRETLDLMLLPRRAAVTLLAVFSGLALLLLVALLASWLPARRTAKVDSVVALRAE